jgi:hypothetical protein
LSAAMTFAPSIGRLDDASFRLLVTASALNVGPLPLKIIWPVTRSATSLSDAALRPSVRFAVGAQGPRAADGVVRAGAWRHIQRS